MSGPIVRTGATRKFSENWDRIFGEGAASGTKKAPKRAKKTAAGAKKTTKAAKKAAKKSGGCKTKKTASKKKAAKRCGKRATKKAKKGR